MDLLLLTAVVTACYQLFFFTIAAAFKFDKVTDFAGGTNFLVLALLTFSVGGTFYTRQVILTGMVTVWSLRLALFLFYRILKWGEDKRFDDTRNDIIKFAIFWVFQALWAWTVSLPVTIANSSTANPPIGAADVVGWAMWVVGLVIEATADQQKLCFKQSEAGRGGWCSVGVWKWSRHPNYFGEILLWLGVFVASTPVLTQQWQWVTAALSPIFTATILLFVSGVPLLETSADKKFGGRSDYWDYKARTSPLIPLPPSVYGSLPRWAKSVFLLELPMYSRHVASDSHTPLTTS